MSKIDDVLVEHGGLQQLQHVIPLAVHPTKRTILLLGTLPSCLKVVGGGGLQDFIVSPRPLDFGFFDFRVWGQGLTISLNELLETLY